MWYNYNQKLAFGGIMAIYERTGQSVIWHRYISKSAGKNLPTPEDILRAARREFPGCCLDDLELISCGEDILLEKKYV